MKRSEMVTKLETMLRTLSLSNDVFKDQAEVLLKFIEELGMLPPSLSEEDRQAIMQVYYAGYSFNKWEEDFEKDEIVQAVKRRRAEAREARLERIKAKRG